MPWGRVSDALVDDWFDQLMAEDWWASIFYTNPHVTDPLTAEVVDADYDRPEMVKNRPSFNLIRNDELLVFRFLPPGTHIEAVGAFNADTNGQLRFACLLDDPVDLVSGGTWTVGVNQLQCGLDVATGP